MSSRKAQREQLRQQRQASQRARERQQLRRRRLWQLGAVAAVAVVVVVIAVALSSGGSSTPSSSGPPVGAAQVNAQFAGIPQNGLTLGNPQAPVTLVEFADLKCPICREYSLAVLPTLIDRYVRPGKVQMVFRNMAFVGEQQNPGDSQAAARMAAAVGMQNQLWPFAELFYLNQQDESTRYVTDSFVSRLASAIPGVNVQQALAQRSTPQVGLQLADANNLFNQSGFQGTPSFLLGKTGQQLQPLTPTALDPSQFNGPIDKLLTP